MIDPAAAPENAGDTLSEQIAAVLEQAKAQNDNLMPMVLPGNEQQTVLQALQQAGVESYLVAAS